MCAKSILLDVRVNAGASSLDNEVERASRLVGGWPDVGSPKALPRPRKAKRAPREPGQGLASSAAEGESPTRGRGGRPNDRAKIAEALLALPATETDTEERLRAATNAAVRTLRASGELKRDPSDDTIRRATNDFRTAKVTDP